MIGELAPSMVLICRDLPYYDASITLTTVDGMNRLASRPSILTDDMPFKAVVATEFVLPVDVG